MKRFDIAIVVVGVLIELNRLTIVSFCYDCENEILSRLRTVFWTFGGNLNSGNKTEREVFLRWNGIPDPKLETLKASPDSDLKSDVVFNTVEVRWRKYAR